MPIKVGLTGGIGSGKSKAAAVFMLMGVSVIEADKVAKDILNSDDSLIKEIMKLFGDDIYESGIINRKKLAEIVFSDKKSLESLNNIVHPATIRAIDRMMSDCVDSDIVIKEAAIMIESSSFKELNFIIGVDAPKDVRMRRVVKRDNVSKDAVMQRMNAQMDNDEKMKMCDYVIMNDDHHSLIEQCADCLRVIKNKFEL